MLPVRNPLTDPTKMRVIKSRRERICQAEASVACSKGCAYPTMIHREKPRHETEDGAEAYRLRERVASPRSEHGVGSPAAKRWLVVGSCGLRGIWRSYS